VIGMKSGDVLGHEPMGVVEEVGSAVTEVAPGDRVVVPFNIACGRCYMCEQGLQSQCETTQNRETKKGASLYGYTRLYGGVPGGQAEYLRAQQAQYSLIKIPDGGVSDDRFLFLSDVLPTAWQAVTYADTPKGASRGTRGSSASSPPTTCPSGSGSRSSGAPSRSTTRRRPSSSARAIAVPTP
jgi:threonine dehydrogenase-like Zn-dependent dehydrogenase